MGWNWVNWVEGAVSVKYLFCTVWFESKIFTNITNYSYNIGFKLKKNTQLKKITSIYNKEVKIHVHIFFVFNSFH